MNYLMMALQLILSLSILVVLHELGHFIPARLFKTRVEKFYLFFDPWFSVFKVKKGDTEYGIGWLPLGGYVKIAGMIDESMDKEQMKQPPQSWEFRSKPAWQRLIIMIGGVTVNLILGMFLFAMVLFVWGKEYLPLEKATYGIMTDSIGTSAGFRNGDRIISVNGVVPQSVPEAGIMALLEFPSVVKVERNGQQLDIAVTQELAEQVIEKDLPFLFHVGFPAIVAEVNDTSAAYGAGLRKDDRIFAVNGTPTAYFLEMKAELARQKGRQIDLTVLRRSDTLTFPVQVNAAGQIGFRPYDIPELPFEFATQKYGFFEAIPAGINEALDKLGKYVQQFKLVFTKAGAQKVGGFITMAKQFDDKWNWQQFWTFTAVLSLILAFMNFLPIPALDGGHILFLLVEIISGRKPGEKFLERAQLVGIVLLLGLMLYANGNDIYRAFK